jgi:pyruvate dehydrogenase E2 component (dihydrolipoamide acetyltransferase)
MVQSWTTIPQFTLWVDVEINALEDFHQALKDKGKSVSFTVLLAKFLALTLKQYPLLNASWRGQGAVEMYSHIHVGIATDTPLGLFVPVLKDCGIKPIQALQEEWQELSRRGKEGKLAPTDLSGGTITLTNLGMFGVKRFQAIVNPPQVAILSVGERRRIPREADPLSFISVIEFGLSADHRVVDGAYGARFLKTFKEALESPLLTLASIV